MNIFYPFEDYGAMRINQQRIEKIMTIWLGCVIFVEKYGDMTQYKLKRAYEQETADDGFRVYVDRLWPQGLSHQTFHYDLWAKDVSPSTELREWFHQDPASRWDEFVKRYGAELTASPAFDTLKAELQAKPVVTLLYSSRNEVHNNAVVLKNMLEGNRI